MILKKSNTEHLKRHKVIYLGVRPVIFLDYINAAMTQSSIRTILLKYPKVSFVFTQLSPFQRVYLPTNEVLWKMKPIISQFHLHPPLKSIYWVHNVSIPLVSSWILVMQLDLDSITTCDWISRFLPVVWRALQCWFAYLNIHHQKRTTMEVSRYVARNQQPTILYGSTLLLPSTYTHRGAISSAIILQSELCMCIAPMLDGALSCNLNDHALNHIILYIHHKHDNHSASVQLTEKTPWW